MNLEKLNNLDKRSRIIVLLVYASIMFISIQSQIGLINFILLFAVLPIGIYFYVKKIFPKKN